MSDRRCATNCGTVTFTATGSPQVVSRAIEEFARGAGPRHRDRRAVGKRRHHAQHGGHRGQERRLGHRAHQPGHHPADRRGPGADRRSPSPPSCRTIPSSRSSPRSSTASSGRSRAGFTSNPRVMTDLVRRSPRASEPPPTVAGCRRDAARGGGARRGHRPRHRAAGAGRSRAHRRPARRRPEDHRPHGRRRARRAVGARARRA